MNYAEIITNSITMKQVAERYGFDVNRQGFIHCPFHGEKTASLKIYPNNKGFYCFGCGVGGNTIDFVKQLFGIGFPETLKKINEDFGLNLSIGRKSSLRERDKFKQAQQRLEAERKKRIERQQEAERAYNLSLAELVRLDNNLRRYKPSESDNELHPLFIEALQKIDYHYYYNYLNYAGGDAVDNNRDDKRTNPDVVSIRAS